MSGQNIQRPASPGGSPDSDIPPPMKRKDTIHLTPYSVPLPYISDDDDDTQVGRRGRSPTRSRVKEDSRSPSMQSLLPVDSNRDGRRTLLLVYIHGFVGSDTSFKKFPAHVHNLLTVMLSESHVVHSKIYPRYKTRKAIEYVRDDFSYWLAPHESSDTDIVLVGHSLGGILAAEIALLGPSDPQITEMFKHRIMGAINLDVPFLGLHPGVVTSGIGSLFRPKEKKKDPRNQPFPVDSSIVEPIISTSVDPNFDPIFPNDVRLTERSQLDGALNFIFKNSNQLMGATKKYISSHVEFGLCIADYPGLKRRYKRLRELEDVDECSSRRDGSGRLFRRIRFVNYYTAATGRIKSPVSGGSNESSAITASVQDRRPTSPGVTYSPEPGHVRSVSVDARRPTDGKEGDHVSSSQAGNEGERSTEVPQLAPEPVYSPLENSDTAPAEDTCFDFPPPPSQPPEFDPSLYDSKILLKEAQRDHSRQMKAYGKALKDREKKIKAHNKLISKQERAAEKEQLRRNKEILLPTSSPSNHNHNSSTTDGAPLTVMEDIESARDALDIDTSVPAKAKVKKDRKFCALPPRDANGERDSLWVRVFMERVDEVTAHQSLFVSRNAAYDRLVGDVAARIEGWVQDDLTTQVLKKHSEDKQ
ncbi:hypothetical protein AJ78_00324 [Emergomyces pasteurianus Ep9510]|uniref:DUF676 domain-containing protein n=1 Tax=Emergomyces pasteurianus Ep9510 TaxID=1447872 RepID=A0A1J9QWM3_9EURO|nr:hypothetical protein AJ78_00324 [Emergomyces pasteurianus Ep9510]